MSLKEQVAAEFDRLNSEIEQLRAENVLLRALVDSADDAITYSSPDRFERAKERYVEARRKPKEKPWAPR